MTHRVRSAIPFFLAAAMILVVPLLVVTLAASMRAKPAIVCSGF